MTSTSQSKQNLGKIGSIKSMLSQGNDNPKKPGKFKMVVIPLLVILLLGIVYFFIYSNKQGQKFDERRFRVLSMLEENIAKKEAGYKEVIGGLKKEFQRDFLRNPSEQQPDETFKTSTSSEMLSFVDRVNARSGQIFENILISDVSSNVDEYGYYLTDYLNAEPYRLIDNEEKINAISERIQKLQKLKSQTKNETLISGYIHSQLDQQISALTDQLNKEFSNYKEITLGVFIKLSDYIEDLIPGNTFDNVLILEKQGDQLGIKFQNLKNKVITDQENSLDSLLSKSAGLLSGNIKHLEVSGERYRVYVHLSNPNSSVLAKTDFGSNLQVSTLTKGQEIICGLVKESKYLASKRKVDVWYIIILSICLIITLVSLPLLKIYLINDIESLDSSDVVLTGVSVIVGAPLLLLIILSIRDYELFSTQDQNAELTTLAQNLDKNLSYEVLSIVDQLKLWENDTSLRNWVHQNSRTDSTTALSDSDLERFRYYDHFNEFFDLRPDGGQNFSFTSYNEPISLPNLRERGYFKALENGDLWKIKSKSRKSDLRKHHLADQEYVMESISSWTTGDHEAVIGIPRAKANDSSKFMVLSSRLVSVMNPIIEPGFGFSIIDKDGKTWFHSNSSRINNENFLEEIGDNSDVKSSIFGRIASTTKATYWGENIRMHIRPSDEFPLYIITFYKIENTRSLIAEIATMCILFIVGAFMLVGFVVLTTAYLEPNKGFFKFKRFVFEWMRPKDDKREAIGISTQMMWYFFYGFIGICIAVYSSSKPLAEMAPNIVAAGLILPVLCYISNYWIIQAHWRYKKYTEENKGPFPEKNVTWIINLFALLLTSLIFKHVFFQSNDPIWHLLEFVIFGAFVVVFLIIMLRLEKAKHTEYAKLLMHAVILQIILLALARYVYFPIFLFFILFWFGITVYYFNKGRGPISLPQRMPFAPSIRIHRWKEILSSKHYLKFLITWLTVSSLVPTFMVFAMSKDLELLLTKRYQQLQMAKVFEDKIRRTPTEFKNTGSEFIERKSRGLIKKPLAKSDEGYYQDYLGGHKISLLEVDDYSTKPVQQAAFSRSEKLLFKLRPIYNNSLSEKRVAMGKFSSDHRWHWQTRKKTNVVSLHYLLDEKLKGKQKAIKVESDRYDQNRAGFFQIMYLDGPMNIVTLVGALVLFIVLIGSVTEYLTLIVFSWKFRNYKNQSITTLDGLKEKLSLGKKSLLIFNSKYAKNAVKTQLNLADDHDLDKVAIQEDGKKLEYLRAMAKQDQQVLLLTSYPTELLDAIQDDQQSDVLSKVISDYVSRYEQVIISERLFDELENVSSDLTDPENVWSMENDEAFDEDMQAFKKQQGSYTYFQDLWNAASNREKYILYDLAEDGFANTKNITSVLYLMDKGLIRWEGKLCLFSKGFRAFILGSIKRSKGRNIEREMSSRGAWSTIKFILYGIIAAVFVFIAIGEPSFFNDFNTLLTVIASVVTLFPVIGGLFSANTE